MLCFLITSILILLSQILKNSKFVYFLDFIWMLFLATTPDGLSDRTIYLLKYENVIGWSSATEYSFNTFMLIAREFNLEFEEFIFVYIFVFLFILYMATYKFTNNYCAVIALYFIFFFCMDVVQLRFAMASAISILAFSYIYKENITKRDYIIFCLLILFASSFHLSALFFYIFLFLLKFSIRKCFCLSVLSAVIGYLFVYVGIADRIVNYFLGGKIYVIRKDYGVYSQIYTIFRMVVAFMQYYIFYLLERSNRMKIKVKTGFIKNRKILMEQGLKMNIIVLAVIGILPFAVDWYRIQQPIIYLNYCLIANCLVPENKGKLKVHNLQIILVACIFSIIELILLVFVSSGLIETIIVPLFHIY